MVFNPAFSTAISGIESGGRYGLLGPTTKSGDRAFGKYQVMGANIPSWTEQYYGQKLTPQEFLANPQAQESVFQGRFGEYVNKYGPEGAAKAWFAGEKGMNNPNAKDALGTTVQGYGDKFMAAFNAAPLTPGTAAPALPPPINVGSLPAPQAQAPFLPAAPQSQQKPPTEVAPQPQGLLAQIPAGSQINAPPIFYAPRRPIDLSGLQAALQASGNRGFFFRG